MSLESLEKGLRTYIGSRKAVVGVHGDLYSTTAAVLCAESIGRDKTICVLPYIRLNDELHVVKEALKDNKLDVRLVDIGRSLAELTSSCYFEDVVSSMYALHMRGPLLGGAALQYMAACIGGVVVSPVTFDHRMLGEITAADRLADLAPFWKLHAGEVWSLAKEMDVSKYALDKIVDPDMVERLGCDLRDATELVTKFNNCDYRDEHGNFVCLHTEQWPSKVTVRTERGFVPGMLSKTEAAVVRAHNKGLPLIRNLSLDMLDCDT